MTFAMQPSANSMRALAMSTRGVRIADARRVDLETSASDEREDDVDVVDHEVHDDVDVEAARREGREPVALDEARLRHDILRAARDGRVEALDVADLQHRAARAREPR